ncbi:hypothetical protein J2797_000893 [Paraburkholderia terricola]|nr:hypothetical protein [Paraburkholderia terricola]
MEPKGIDMGDYQERYQDYDIEVAVEQVLTGVKAHFSGATRWWSTGDSSISTAYGPPSTPPPKRVSRPRAK